MVLVLHLYMAKQVFDFLDKGFTTVVQALSVPPISWLLKGVVSLYLLVFGLDMVTGFLQVGPHCLGFISTLVMGLNHGAISWLNSMNLYQLIPLIPLDPSSLDLSPLTDGVASLVKVYQDLPLQFIPLKVPGYVGYVLGQVAGYLLRFAVEGSIPLGSQLCLVTPLMLNPA